MRMTMYAQPIQKSGSKAFIEKKLSVARMPGATSTASAARPCAKRRPPNSGANVGLPIINEMANNISGHRGVIVNRSAAKKMGIAEGDDVVIESVSGITEGKAVLREGIRPDTVLMIGQFGHWKTPYAKDLNRPSLNSLTDISLKLTDNTGSGADLMRVKLYKASDRHLHVEAR